MAADIPTHQHLREKTMKVNCLTDSHQALIHPTPKHGGRQMDLTTLFLELPRTIDRMLEERGLATPVPRLDNEAYMQLLDPGVDTDTHEGVFERGNNAVATFERVQVHLNRCSTKALAIHLYINELVKLMAIATRQKSKPQQQTGHPSDLAAYPVPK